MSYSRKTKDIYDHGMLNSFKVALEGVVHILRSERSMRVHFIVGLLVLVSGVYFSLEAVEFMLLCFAITFVLVAELFNSAIEHAIDLIHDEYHPLAKISKDIAAGAVFISVINAIITGYLLFAERLHFTLEGNFDSIKHSSGHVTLIAFLVVVGVVILVKVLRHEKQLLRGGMPSGHTAVAFSIWIAVSILTGIPIVSVAVLLLAILVGRSRITSDVHNLWEVIAGALIGILLTLLVFQVLL